MVIFYNFIITLKTDHSRPRKAVAAKLHAEILLGYSLFNCFWIQLFFSKGKIVSVS